MAKRKPTARVQVPIRMLESLRAALEKSAKARGVSLNSEVVARLDRSLNTESTFEAAFGGPELHQTALLMAAAFASAGRASSGKANASEWMRDRDAYRAAVIGVMDALLIGFPNADHDDAVLIIESLKGRLLTRLANEGGDKQ